MDQTLHQIGSLVLFQIRTLCVSTVLSLKLGFQVLASWLTRLYTELCNSDHKQRGGTKKDDAIGSEAQDWVVIGNAERKEAQSKAGKRKKKPSAQTTTPDLATPASSSLAADRSPSGNESSCKRDSTARQPSQSKGASPSESLCLYEGIVRHHRVHPVSHFFQYTVRYALVNLDDCPEWFQKSSADLHMSAAEAREYAGSSGAVWLLTNPVSVGYEQNPISVYYCYEDRDAPPSGLAICIAEVTNTPWGERVLFTFDPNGDLVPKPLHVSPFMDMSSSWTIRASPPGEKLELTFIAKHPDLGPYFTASLQATKVTREVRHPEAFLWLMPHKTALWIYWQAFWLWWKGVEPVSHPKYVNGSEYQIQVLDRAKKEEGLDRGAAVRKEALRSSGLSCPVFKWRSAGGPPWL
ncbi:hypothetical protein KFL_005390070 [Klebsormidium nitens]|uniref:DUF1365 domain containing protein n=1 Tax=Klebsormidium nitens TaxID=105231 RepID=A0A1Y1ILS7_KLENI|nr:hypothetical protein KFL_005390070 [Klebsormidium nitens]|eukprot:GAQ89587.1 hypothetical protein KFL_005390070 [Klebsormidium nitens]